MLESRIKRYEDDIVRDKYVHAVAEHYMTVRDQAVYVDTTDGAMTVYLPPVHEATGKIFAVYLAVDNGNLTIADLDDSRAWEGDYTLDDALEYKLFYSDGEKWYVIAHRTI